MHYFPTLQKSLVYINVVKHIWKDLRERLLKEIIFVCQVFFKKSIQLSKVRRLLRVLYRYEDHLGGNQISQTHVLF